VNRLPINRRSKYNNVKTVIDGITFASMKEARRYSVLSLLQKTGEISNLRLQVPFKIVVNGILICTYKADFVYNDRDGKQIIEDTKGMRTQVYNLKKKLLHATSQLQITET